MLWFVSLCRNTFSITLCVAASGSFLIVKDLKDMHRVLKGFQPNYLAWTLALAFLLSPCFLQAQVRRAWAGCKARLSLLHPPLRLPSNRLANGAVLCYHCCIDYNRSRGIVNKPLCRVSNHNRPRPSTAICPKLFVDFEDGCGSLRKRFKTKS